MKKRLIITNVVIVFASLILLFVASYLILTNINSNNAKKEIKNYLNMTCEYFTGNNVDQTVSFIKKTNTSIRLTIIDFEGNVVAETTNNSGLDSHKDRLEIQNPGVVYTRYSSTLKRNMMYVAKVEHNYFIRIAIPADSINSIVNIYLGIGSVSIILILLVSLIITFSFSKHTLAPVNEVVNRLGKIVGNKNYYGLDSIETIAEQINLINNEINTKILNLKNEQEKLQYIINSLEEGLVVLNASDDIVLINKKSCSIFDYSSSEVLNRNASFLFGDSKFNSVLGTKKFQRIDMKIENKIFLVEIVPIANEWLLNGTIVTLIDVTNQRNIEKVKREFFANASHELKSPLTTIIGYQQMINEGILDDEKSIHDATKKTIKEATRMNRLIIDMLELSKLESEILHETQDIRPKEIINEIVANYASQIQDKNIEIKLMLSDMILKVNANHFYEMVKNILENAIKYNREGGKIIISLDDTQFSVQDSGIGIPKEDQNRVFERFYRVNKNQSKSLGGTGLGLAIVKHICSIYHFKIVLNSEVSKGTKISVEF